MGVRYFGTPIQVMIYWTLIFLELSLHHYMKGTTELSCTETNPYEQVSLIGKFNGNNFEGAYNYKREGENSEEGTFNFIRQ